MTTGLCGNPSLTPFKTVVTDDAKVSEPGATKGGGTMYLDGKGTACCSASLNELQPFSELFCFSLILDTPQNSLITYQVAPYAHRNMLYS